MSKRPPRRSKGGLTPEQIQQLKHFKLNDRDAIETLLRIEDRDNAGRMIPFKLNFPQAELHAMWEKIRALNILQSVKDKSNIEKILGEPLAPSLSKQIEQLYLYNVSSVLYELKQLRVKCVDGPVRIIIGKPRQVGISTYVQGRFFIKSMFSENFSTNVTAHKESAAQNVLRKSKLCYDYWPSEYMGIRTSADSNSRDGMQFAHNSRFVAQTSGGRNAARSYTFSAVHLSESAHYEDYSAVAALLQAVPKWGTVIDESTGNGRSGPFYEKWQSALEFDSVVSAIEAEDAQKVGTWNRYFRFFIPWFMDKEYMLDVGGFEQDYIMQTLDKIELQLISDFGAQITPQKLAWRRWKLANDCAHVPGMTPEEYFKQEFPSDEHEMFQGSGARAFNQEALEVMKKRNKDKPAKLSLVLNQDWMPLAASSTNSNLFVWKEPIPSHQYSIGVDTGKGLRKKDYSVISIFDRCDGTIIEEVCRWRGHIEPLLLGDIVTMLAEWYAGAFVTPEANDQGQVVCRRLLDNRYPFLFRRRVMDRASDTAANEKSWYIGVVTTGMSKQHLIGRAQAALINKTIELVHPEAIREWMLYENQNGKYNAPSGEHDDCVMADALALFGHEVGAPPVQRHRAQQAEIRRKLQPSDLQMWQTIQKAFQETDKQNKNLLGKEWLPELEL
jgi:hypothetical protein